MLLVVLMFFFYKNVFCEKCNGYCSLNEEVLIFNGWVLWGDYLMGFYMKIMIIYRSIFLLSFYI